VCAERWCQCVLCGVIQAKAKEREKELNRQFADKERHLQETQMIVARKLGESEHRVSTLQSGQSVCPSVCRSICLLVSW